MSPSQHPEYAQYEICPGPNVKPVGMKEPGSETLYLLLLRPISNSSFVHEQALFAAALTVVSVKKLNVMNMLRIDCFHYNFLFYILGFQPN